MSRWVKKDDVFALAPPDGGTMAALQWSLLQVEQAPAEDAHTGVCVCRFFHRWEVSIAGYRCIKLGTVQTPLRIRWTQRQKVRNGFKIKPPDATLMVEIRRHGFVGEDPLRLQSDPNGFMETASKGKDGVFQNVAFIRISSGLGESHPHFPIPLVDDQLVPIEVPASKGDSLFTYRVSEWQRRVADSVRMQADLFKRLEVLGSKSENRSEMIEAAKSGWNRAKADHAELAGGRDKLNAEAKKDKKDLKTPTEDRLMQQLEDYEEALATFIDKAKKIEDTENDPQRRRWLTEIENAKLRESELEIGKAIEIYDRIRNQGYESAELDQHLKELHEKWDIRSPEHDEARKFIYDVWPTLDLSSLEENVAKAQNALKTCAAKEVHDSISIRKLLHGTLGYADRLERKLAELQMENTTTAETEALQFKKVSEQIVKLGEEIQASLKSLGGK